MPETATVPVKPATKSKINWTQIVAVASTMLALVGFDLTAEQQVAVVVVIQLIGNVVTMILRTKFNNTVTPSAATVNGGTQ